MRLGSEAEAALSKRRWFKTSTKSFVLSCRVFRFSLALRRFAFLRSFKHFARRTLSESRSPAKDRIRSVRLTVAVSSPVSTASAAGVAASPSPYSARGGTVAEGLPSAATSPMAASMDVMSTKRLVPALEVGQKLALLRAARGQK